MKDAFGNRGIRITGVGANPAIVIVRLVPGPWIKSVRIGLFKRTMSHVDHDRAATPGAAIRIGTAINIRNGCGVPYGWRHGIVGGK